MTKNILAGIGILTLAYHSIGFSLGVAAGIKEWKQGEQTQPPSMPRLRLVWSSE